MKSVAVLGLFVIIMASATVYSSYRSALAKPVGAQSEAPSCTVYFDPDTSEVKAGETFTVTVLVDDVKDLWGYEIGLVFDRFVLDYIGAKEPHWRFISGGGKEFLFWVAGTSPQSGQVELIEFTFKAKAEGGSLLSFYLHNLATVKYWRPAKGHVGWPIPHTLSEGFVTVSA